MGDLAREQAKQRSAALAAVRADQIPDTEMEALRDLFESTSRGKGWRHTYGWDGGEGIAVSTWFGVTVFRRHVTEITLPGNGLDGPLPGTLVCQWRRLLLRLRDFRVSNGAWKCAGRSVE